MVVTWAAAQQFRKSILMCSRFPQCKTITQVSFDVISCSDDCKRTKTEYQFRCKFPLVWYDHLEYKCVKSKPIHCMIHFPKGLICSMDVARDLVTRRVRLWNISPLCIHCFPFVVDRSVAELSHLPAKSQNAELNTFFRYANPLFASSLFDYADNWGPRRYNNSR